MRRLSPLALFCALAAWTACTTSPAVAQSTRLGIKPFCDPQSEDYDPRTLARSRLTRVNVVIDDSRKWAKNNLRILRTRTNNILAKYKKKFDSSVSVRFANGLTCTFKARLRQSGDLKDHIQFIDGQFINSLDVSLEEGHVNGIVQFKLFIPSTREGRNEVILANLFRSMGFIAPRTSLVTLDLMGRRAEMIFQEKPRKEMLEDVYLREGPILEGDERFAWVTSETHANTLRHHVIAFEDSLVFSRLVNRKWAAKGPESSRISADAVHRLNAAYLKSAYLNHIAKEDTTRVFFDNNILANGSPSQLARLNAYNAILQAANANHGLRPHNRKFYFDPMYGHFRPIYYDGDAKLGELLPPHVGQNLGITKFAVDGAAAAQEMIAALKPADFAATLRAEGVDMSDAETRSILETLKDNLRKIGALEAPDYSAATPPSAEDYLRVVLERKDADIMVARMPAELARGPNGLTRVETCKQRLKVCRPKNLALGQVSELLAGELDIDGTPALFLGFSDGSASAARGGEGSRLRGIAPGVELIVSPGMAVETDADARRITFRQRAASDWALLRGGALENVSLVFEGAPNPRAAPVGAQRFNDRLLTGCLNLVDMKVKNVDVVVDGGGCEDSLNMVRVAGHMASISVTNAGADAVDFDFSRLVIDEIVIADTGNDCLDVSAGHYEIGSIRTRNCGDKGISIGEGSRVDVTRAAIDTANIGVAVKDSSEFSARNVLVRNGKTCIAAYRKKPEFSGALAKVAESTCHGGAIHADPGSAVLTEFRP